MATRWGAGEETLTTCAMDFFPMDTLEETSGRSSGETLEAFQSCLDPSILSIFEDTTTIETKGLDGESEATLLTALTEILDNVDEETLSPFDTLPDAELLSGQKGREQSPLRRMLCLSRSPPEKDVRSSARILSNGKNLPRKQANSLQRSDGEEEEDGSHNLSPAGHDLSPDNELLGWEGLTLPLPVSFGHEGEDGVSVSLGDLVRHMHPYCMAISVENEVGEQMLPEGGIVLEVVDQGENGEPILAIPNLSFSPPPMELSAENEKKVSVDTEDMANDTSEDIVVVDDDEDLPVSVASVKIAARQTTSLLPHVKDEMTDERQKEDTRAKSSLRRKKKKKCKERPQSNPVEKRVLRSATKGAKESAKEPEVITVKEKKHKAPKTPIVSISSPSGLKETLPRKIDTQSETTTTTVLPHNNVVVASVSPRRDAIPLADEKSLATEVRPRQPNGILKHTASVDPTAAPTVLQATASSVSPVVRPNSEVTEKASSVTEVPPPVIPAVPEPKPKSLSLEQYRKLRQQKKPVPMEKSDANSTKWPSLPELPTELPPIPCLPDPNPKDPRRFNPPSGKNEAEEVKPAWQPRGPGAPPTPEALLAPPAYMVASSNRVSASNPTSKPKQASDPSRLPQQPSTTPSNSVNDSATDRPTTAQPAALCEPQTCGRSDVLATQQLISSAERKSSPRVPAGKGGCDEIPQSQPISLVSKECAETSSKTTTDVIKPITICGTPTSLPQKTNAISHSIPKVTTSVSLHKPVAAESKPSKPNVIATPLLSTESQSNSQKAILKLVPQLQKKPTTTLFPQKAKSSTQELIEAFTAEIGIEAADLTSLLEQFEETQAKEDQCVPEVSGRAAAVGNSSVELVPEKSLVERVRANNLSSTAALTPPATPPHQMWKPLAPVALLGKNKLAEATQSNSSKVIQIEARPLPLVKSRKTMFNSTPVDPAVASMDHDYCLPNNGTGAGETGKRWHVKQQSHITIKPIKQQAATTTQMTPAVPATSLQSTSKPNHLPQTQAVECRSNDEMKSSVLETPDASPTRQENEPTCKDQSPRRGHFGRSYRRHTSSRSSSPAQSPKERSGGRSRKRKPHRSPSPMSSYSESESHSSRSRSRSFSPAKKRYRRRRSESSRSSSSSSCSSSLSRYSVSRSPPRRRRYSYSSSRSGSWSRSRSRSQSPQRRGQWNRSRRFYSPTYRSYYSQGPQANLEEVKIRKEKAIEERRVVYVGRIRGTMTQKELKERFSYFGEIEECTLHFRDHGDNYGFVTYYDTKDAFTAIENGSRLRKPDELPFDLCFGGRRQFCQTSYADLDSNREYDPLPSKGKFHALDFDTLLKQAQQNLKR